MYIQEVTIPRLDLIPSFVRYLADSGQTELAMSVHVTISMILCLLFTIFLPSICEDKTFYIKPTESIDCPRTFLSPCLTLDEFAHRELHARPFGNLFPSSFMLKFLPGNHTSCVNIDFVNIDFVTMTGVVDSPSAKSFEFDLENPRVMINLICSDIQIHSGFNISYLAINGGGNFSVVMRDNLKELSINLHQVKLISSAVLINSGSNMTVSVSRVVFAAGKIAVNSTFMADISVKDSIFLSGDQPQTLAFCHKGLHYYPGWLPKPQEFIHVLQVIIDKVTLSDLPQNDAHLEPPSHVHLTSFCDITKSRLDSSSDFSLHFESSSKFLPYITVVNLSIINSNFSHSQKNSTAIILELLQSSLILIANTTISGYTQGAIVSLNHWMSIYFVLHNVSVHGNSLSQPIIEDLEMNAGAGLTIYNYIHKLPDPMYYKVSNCIFQNNVDYQEKSEIVLLYGMHGVDIKNSTFSNNHGTSISVHDSKFFSFLGFVEFKNNSAKSGGALALYASTLKIQDMATVVHFCNNRASKFGGAIYVDNPSFDFITSINRPCFYHSAIGLNISFHIHFENNVAKEGGDSIYGAQVGEKCMVNAIDYNVKPIFTFVPNNTLSVVSSRATRVCLCDPDGNLPQCTDKSKVFVTNMTAYPGEIFSINVITVGADLGTTTGMVYAKLMHSPNGSITGCLGHSHREFEYRPDTVSSKDHCTTLNYSIYSQNKYEVLYLVSRNASYTREYRDYYYSSVDTAIEEYASEDTVSTVLLTTPIFINIALKDCPPGFSMTGDSPYMYCDCYTELRSYKINCVLVNGVGSITREGDIWIGVDSENEMMFNDKCLSGYCKQESVAIRMEGWTNESDAQCAFNHAGTLCGGCQEDYSLSLGSNHCLYCPGSSANVALVAFLLGGLILVGIVLLLDLKIENGGMNGLIFYANIVWAYRLLIFPHSDADINSGLLKAIKYFFKIFIATLNLDIGFEICFWNGMDAFWKSIFQFAFPVYIWIITCVAVVVMKYLPCCVRCIQRCAKCKCAQRPVEVLVTLILMSYAKLIRTILSVFTFSILKIYPGGTTKVVWGLDGNVPYLSGKHIALFLIALIALFLALAYTIYISIVGLKHCIFKDDNDSKCVFKMCRKILDMPLPLYDAHFASFKKNHKYWLGLLLFVRAILLLVFSSTLGISPVVNLPILILIITLLLFWMGWKDIYKKKSVWALQGLSLSNLIAISGGVLFAELSDKEMLKSILVCVSVGIAFLQFAGIAVHSIVQYFRKCALPNSSGSTVTEIDVQNANNRSDGAVDVGLYGTHEELREPLLDDYSDYDT